MRVPARQPRRVVSPGFRPAAGRPAGRAALSVAHVVWVLVVLIDAVVFLPAAVFYDQVAHTVCPSHTVSASKCALGQPNQAAMQQLAHLGVSIDVYAALVATFAILCSSIFCLIGALIARRKWNEGIGLLASALLITLGSSGGAASFVSVAGQILPSLSPTLAGILQIVGAPIFILQWPALGIFLLTFPTGRFAPHWTWLLVGLWITNFFAFILSPPYLVTMLSVVVTFGSVVATQIYRYRHVYRAVERQQTKWLLYLLSVAVAVEVIQSVSLALTPARQEHALPLAQTALDVISGSLTFLLAGIGIAVALLRYRLYDIDLVINRTLVYGSATLSIGALYIGTVIALQDLARLITGQSSDVAVAIATLAIAALFSPWRRRLQTFVDRRFYRRRYDASRVLHAFQMRARDEVDLDRLSDDLVTVVQETMQPAQVTLWVAPAVAAGRE